MERAISGPVRVVVLVALAAPQLFTGLWAVLAPANWYANFPGLGPALVAAEPPYNHHLVTDAGAGFLAIGIALAVAAWVGSREALLVALAAYVGAGVAHLAYHLSNPVDDLSTGGQVSGALLLAAGLAVAAWLAWLLRPAPSAPQT